MNTFPDPVFANAAVRPDALAVVTPSLRWTWSDLNMRVASFVGRLRREALSATASRPIRIGLMGRTTPDVVVAILGSLRAGAVVVPLSPRWPGASVETARTALSLDLWLEEVGAIGAPSLADWIAPGAGQIGDVCPEIVTDRQFTIVYTSGSSGEPKPAMHTVRNHVASARGLAAVISLGFGDRWLLDLPLHHVGGLGVVVRCVLTGATMAIPDRGMTTAESFHVLRPSHASLVSTQLKRLLEDRRPIPPLKAVLLGGSAFPSDVLRAAGERALPVWTSYGLTEMTSTVTAARFNDEPQTSGESLPGRELRIGDDGQIEVRGETLFAGYLGSDGLELSVGDDGWFRTGDLGSLDEQGHLVVSGRRDRRFVSGGENVQPEAIEAALQALESVADAVVVSVADSEFGERPVAFVQTADLAPPNDVALSAALRGVLPGFMVPVAFHQWDGRNGMKPDLVKLAMLAERLNK